MFHCVCLTHFACHLVMDIGCFCILTAMHSTAMNMYAQLSVKIFIFIFWGNIPRRWIFGSCSSSMFNFSQKPMYCFQQWLHHKIFPPAAYRCSNFSTSLSTFVIFCFYFYDSHPNWCEEVSNYSFNFISLMSSDNGRIFMCLLAFCVSFLKNCLFKFFARFFFIKLFVLLLLLFGLKTVIPFFLQGRMLHMCLFLYSKKQPIYPYIFLSFQIYEHTNLILNSSAF